MIIQREVSREEELLYLFKQIRIVFILLFNFLLIIIFFKASSSASKTLGFSQNVKY